MKRKHDNEITSSNKKANIDLLSPIAPSIKNTTEILDIFYKSGIPEFRIRASELRARYYLSTILVHSHLLQDLVQYLNVRRERFSNETKLKLTSLAEILIHNIRTVT